MANFTSNLILGQKIANGHFGDVHLADDDIHGEVAVKIPRQWPGKSDADWQVRRAALLTEGKHLKKATHKHIIQLFGRVPDIG